MTNDSINHPSHYNQYEGIEVIDLVEQMNFNKGNAVKYITRAGFKNPETEIEDLKKAQWYIEREIQRLSPPTKTLMVSVPAIIPDRCIICRGRWLDEGLDYYIKLEIDTIICGHCNEPLAMRSLAKVTSSNEETIPYKIVTKDQIPDRVKNIADNLESTVDCLEDVVSPTALVEGTPSKIKELGKSFRAQIEMLRGTAPLISEKLDLKCSLPKVCPSCTRNWGTEGLDYIIRYDTKNVCCVYCGFHLDIRMLLDAN